MGVTFESERLVLAWQKGTATELLGSMATPYLQHNRRKKILLLAAWARVNWKTTPGLISPALIAAAIESAEELAEKDDVRIDSVSIARITNPDELTPIFSSTDYARSLENPGFAWERHFWAELVIRPVYVYLRDTCCIVSKPGFADIIRDIMPNPYVTLFTPCKFQRGQLKSGKNVMQCVDHGQRLIQTGQSRSGEALWSCPLSENYFNCVVLDDRALETARRIYQTQDYSAMPILADYLEEERGCLVMPLLDAMRHPGPHYKGCWPIDFILRQL